MKINWFSPLPPAHSDIARVTRGLLPLLAEQAEIVIWSSDPDWSPEIEEFGEVHYYDPNKPSWHKINQADVTIYLIGNDPQYHGAIWAVSRQHPGIVVLHDLKLQDFFLVLAEQNRFIDKNEYLRMTAFHYGNAGRKLAESYFGRTISLGELADHCSLVEFATENALAVVAHSQAGYDQLTDDASLPAAYIPLCVCGPMPRIDLDRRTEVVTDDPYRIIIFGFLGRNRRVDVFLKTFAEFPQCGRFRLDIYGTSQTEEITQQLICELGLGESVTMGLSARTCWTRRCGKAISRLTFVIRQWEKRPAASWLFGSTVCPHLSPRLVGMRLCPKIRWDSSVSIMSGMISMRS